MKFVGPEATRNTCANSWPEVLFGCVHTCVRVNASFGRARCINFDSQRENHLRESFDFIGFYRGARDKVFSTEFQKPGLVLIELDTLLSYVELFGTEWREGRQRQRKLIPRVIFGEIISQSFEAFVSTWLAKMFERLYSRVCISILLCRSMRTLRGLYKFWNIIDYLMKHD